MKCQYCNKVNCDDVEERDFDYYTCDKMNDFDLKEYGKYDSLDNEVDEDNCKYYLCDTCEFKIELEKKEN